MREDYHIYWTRYERQSKNKENINQSVAKHRRLIYYSHACWSSEWLAHRLPPFTQTSRQPLTLHFFPPWRLHNPLNWTFLLQPTCLHVTNLVLVDPCFIHNPSPLLLDEQPWREHSFLPMFFPFLLLFTSVHLSVVVSSGFHEATLHSVSSKATWHSISNALLVHQGRAGRQFSRESCNPKTVRKLAIPDFLVGTIFGEQTVSFFSKRWRWFYLRRLL